MRSGHHPITLLRVMLNIEGKSMKEENIDALIPQDKLAEFARLFLREYLKDGFGAQPKRHIDLYVFHLLENMASLDRSDNNALSHKLQITESRVKSYRYESKLRFVPEEENYIQRRILWSLAHSEFNTDADKIKFIVEDPYVRKSLNAIAKRLGGVPDTSFNSEVVALSLDHLQKLIVHLFGETTAGQYKVEFDKLKQKNSKITFDEVRKKVVLGAARALGGGLVNIATAYLNGY